MLKCEFIVVNGDFYDFLFNINDLFNIEADILRSNQAFFRFNHFNVAHKQDHFYGFFPTRTQIMGTFLTSAHLLLKNWRYSQKAMFHRQKKIQTSHFHEHKILLKTLLATSARQLL